MPGDNINRIIEMAENRLKYAQEKQTEIDNLQAKINAGSLELDSPFPQQEEFDKLSLRSSELTHLLNEDADSKERDNANLKFEKERRISSILDGEPDSLCDKSFFIFANSTSNDKRAKLHHFHFSPK